MVKNAKLYKDHALSKIKGVMYKMDKIFTITKRISKHGSQAVITIPRVLEEELKPGTIAEVRITVLREASQ